jgi:hypothetical protein
VTKEHKASSELQHKTPYHPPLGLLLTKPSKRVHLRTPLKNAYQGSGQVVAPEFAVGGSAGGRGRAVPLRQDEHFEPTCNAAMGPFSEMGSAIILLEKSGTCNGRLRNLPD